MSRASSSAKSDEAQRVARDNVSLSAGAPWRIVAAGVS
jgi:hypothetical protein